MNDVDILSELRAWRDEFARTHGYDIHAMAAALRAMDRGNRKVVRGEPRRPIRTRMRDADAQAGTDRVTQMPD